MLVTKYFAIIPLTIIKNFQKVNFQQIFFRNLHRQVVTVTSEQGPSTHLRVLAIASFSLTLVHNLVFSTALYKDFPEYFEYDILFGKIFYQSAALRGQYFTFLFNLEMLFSLRLFCLLYLGAEKLHRQLVWSHLYEMVVKTTEGAKLNLWKKVPPNKTIKFFANWYTYFRPNLISFNLSQKLLHYPQLKQSFKTRYALVVLIF